MRTFRSPRAIVAALAATAVLGACSETSSPLAPAPEAAPHASLLGTVGGLLGGVVGLVGGLVTGVVNGLPLTKPLTADRYAPLRTDVAAMRAATQHRLATTPYLSCAAPTALPVSKRIGPAGGVITIGAHKLSIPAGALDSTVTITASLPGANAAMVDFQPHGLHFNVPVEITLSYAGCQIPANSYFNVVYSDASSPNNVILDGMPSNDRRTLSQIVALTDHFSGYIVAWGIRGEE